MFDTIVSNVVVPAAIVALFIVLPLRRVLRRGDRGTGRRPASQADRLLTAAMLTGFGPFWHGSDLGRHLDVAARQRHTRGR